MDSAGDSQYTVTGESIVQKRPSDRTHRRRKRLIERMRDGDISDDSDDSDYIDYIAVEDSEISNDDSIKFPRHPKPRHIFACPFQKYDPVRYRECLKVQPSRVSSIIDHIHRRHVLKEIRLTIADPQTSKTIIRPEDESLYCARCRREFRGTYAVPKFRRHGVDKCETSDIRQTGVLLPREMEDLRLSIRSLRPGSGDVEKWNAIWKTCFPGSATPPSPYLEMGVPQPEAQQILQQLLNSSAANPWASTENKHSEIQKALSAIYKGLPPAEFESQINDASINLSADTSDISRYGESSFDAQAGTFSSFHDHSSGYYGTPNYYFNHAAYEENPFDFPGYPFPIAPKSPVGPPKVDQETISLKTAIQNVDHDKVHAILSSSFIKVAIDEYAWLLELKALGLSLDEIADELLERAQYGPWIYSKFNVPDVETFRHDFHIAECLHTDKEDESMPTVSSQLIQDPMRIEVDSENSVREPIQYFCGIGGVTPMPDGSPNLQFGSVVFEDASSVAIVSLMNSQFFEVVPNVMEYLSKAIGTLQQVGGCCDSFTFLARREDLVELQRVKHGRMSGLEALASGKNSESSLEDLDSQLLSSLTAQLFSLGFSFYAQGHCEPFKPFFLDTPLKRILLIGNQIWGPSFTGPCVLASAVELSCFGEMIERRVFAFQYFEAFERSKVFSDSDKKFDLKACPEDLLDTWGPGEFIIPKDDPENLHAIHIGGGLITSTPVENNQVPTLHWNRLSSSSTPFASTFPRNEKLVIGLRVSINQACALNPQWFEMSLELLQELGTHPSFWEVSERQVGVGGQAGQSAVGILSFTQTWVKRLGQTRKAKLLASRSLLIADLEGHFAVQVSFCTGIARRVSLRELLADVLSIYVAGLATKPHRWDDLEQSGIEEILRDNNFKTRLQKLDRELQKEFETLAFAVLFLLQDTGVDRHGEHFVVSCVSTGLATQCVKIPLARESFWAKILSDSDEVATFAYVTPTCFQTGAVSCRGGTGPWKNITTLFSTTMSLCQDQSVQQGTVAPMTNWTLQDAEEYHIGRSDRPFRVRVLRPRVLDEPELLISISKIETPVLNSLIMKTRYKVRWRRRLRESRAIDHQYGVAESVVVSTDLRALR
ncbi:hypothetical protein BFJ72_g8276 [Fusarium proliferatum]|uniref:Uncharacterized protein n=1 Tax=Gibberella intermedia TaxID=948311 RepID=A0A420T5A4_GIBIN|nr:hypothetical protein BFJ72_g8276 [Fusarium proliferatum]